MVWIKSKTVLTQFMNEINQNYRSIKFAFQVLKRRYRFSGYFNVDRQQQQTPDHPIQNTN